MNLALQNPANSLLVTSNLCSNFSRVDYSAMARRVEGGEMRIENRERAVLP